MTITKTIKNIRADVWKSRVKNLFSGERAVDCLPLIADTTRKMPLIGDTGPMRGPEKTLDPTRYTPNSIKGPEGPQNAKEGV